MAASSPRASAKPALDDWVARAAGEVRAEGERRHPGEPPTCASGISPSGPVHLGNLRELMVPHLVADEVRRSGVPCRHILSWDDYDRLRRVPAGFPEEFAEHVGRPLTAVPDPCGSHPNWAEHFKEPLRDALDRLGVQVTEISQTEMYTSGAYTASIITAMRRRADIDAVLGRYRTKKAAEPDDDDEPRSATSVPAARATVPRRSRRCPASWSGRSTGRCGGPTSG
jgi:lysyl-tRNA synthetase class 1